MKFSKETLMPLAGGIVIGAIANTVVTVVLVVHGLRKNEMIRESTNEAAKDMAYDAIQSITERIIFGDSREEVARRRIRYNGYGGSILNGSGIGLIPVPNSEEK